MKLKKIIFATFSMCALSCYAGPNGTSSAISHSHLNEYNYPTKTKDTLGKARMYVPDAKTDLDREIGFGELPQYKKPNHYGYSEIKFKNQTNIKTTQEFSTPHFGEKVSKRRATKNTFPITHPDGIYHYRDGIFYLQKGDVYEIHAPHVGFRVPSIPAERRKYTFDGVDYFYYYGTFYVLNQDVKMYDVAEPPVGAVVDWIPSDAEKKVIDGELYHVANGVIYKESSMSVGTMKWYEVVGRE